MEESYVLSICKIYIEYRNCYIDILDFFISLKYTLNLLVRIKTRMHGLERTNVGTENPGTERINLAPGPLIYRHQLTWVPRVHTLQLRTRNRLK